MTQTQETPHTQDATPQAWHDAVRAVADQATRTLPQCASRIARAVALVLAGAVELLPDGTREITHVRPLEGSIVLNPDVQAYFPDAEAVNTALRGLIALRPRRRRGRKAPS